MEQKTVEQHFDRFLASVEFAWSPGSRLFYTADTERDIATDCDNELTRISSMVERVLGALGDAARNVAAFRNRNSLASILAEDVLLLIFETCVSFGSPSKRLRTTLSISHVCSYWRSLSLSHHVLWSRMDLSTIPEQLAWMLCERSGNYPLSTFWPISIYSTSRRDFASTLCSRYLPRMLHLSLSATRSQILPWIYDGRATQIQRVFLQDADAFSQSPLILDRPLFCGQTPHLRHLSLVGIRFPWAAGVYRSLTTLEILRCNAGPDVAGDVDICHIFRDSPSLEAFALSLRPSLHWNVAQDTLLPAEAHASKELERTPLRSLRSLKLELPAPYAAHILRTVTLPKELDHLSLCFDSPQSHSSLLLEIFQSSLVPAEILASVDRLQICDCPSKGSVQICGYLGDRAYPRWEYSWKHRNRPPHSLLRDIAAALAAHYPLPLVQTVQLVAEEGSGHVVGDVLPLLTRLSGMSVFHTLSWNSAILHGMFAACEASGSSPWPSLRELHLVISAFEPTVRATQDAIAGLCRSSSCIQSADITYRMAPFLEAEARLVQHVVQTLHDMDISIFCRRVNPYQAHGPLEPVEEFMPV